MYPRISVLKLVQLHCTSIAITECKLRVQLAIKFWWENSMFEVSTCTLLRGAWYCACATRWYVQSQSHACICKRRYGGSSDYSKPSRMYRKICASGNAAPRKFIFLAVSTLFLAVILLFLGLATFTFTPSYHVGTFWTSFVVGNMVIIMNDYNYCYHHLLYLRMFVITQHQ